MGIFGKPGDKGFGDIVNPIIILIAIGFIVYIFGSSLNLWSGPYDIFSWWTPEVTEILIVVFIFGLIVKLITGEKKNPTPDGKSWFENWGKKLFPKE